MPARLSRSNEATGRVTKGQAVQPAFAGLTNEVVPRASEKHYFPLRHVITVLGKLIVAFQAWLAAFLVTMKFV